MTVHTPSAFVLAVGLSVSLAQAGPDVIVGSITSSNHYGSVGDIHAYSLGTITCNIGDEQLDFFANTPDHPVFAQNMYRLADGRFEQIGMSWLLHGFAALQQAHCGTCQPAQNVQHLGVMCSDTVGAGLAGAQFGMGPRSDVDPTTGIFPFPPTDGGQSGDAIYKRLQVKEADLSTPDARFYFEVMHVAPDDAAAGNGLNNPSWREAQVFANFNTGMVGEDHREQPALFAWAQADPSVRLDMVDIPGDGRYWIGSRASVNGEGGWDYEYAVFNLNSNRAAGGFRVPIGTASASAVGFHDVDYHSGEPYDGTDWFHFVGSDDVAWATDSFFANPNANALRWGTMYNFRFSADQGPAVGSVELAMFAPGAPATTFLSAWVPESSVCRADFNMDGDLDFFDVAAFLQAFADMNPQADFTGEGLFDFFDAAAFLQAFSDGCP